jgi:hypothetical protein
MHVQEFDAVVPMVSNITPYSFKVARKWPLLFQACSVEVQIHTAKKNGKRNTKCM